MNKVKFYNNDIFLTIRSFWRVVSICKCNAWVVQFFRRRNKKTEIFQLLVYQTYNRHVYFIENSETFKIFVQKLLLSFVLYNLTFFSLTMWEDRPRMNLFEKQLHEKRKNKLEEKLKSNVWSEQTLSFI
jgi:hypothetical protein